ncbi:MAG: DUF484 family protein [Rhodospirillaceae bacterium]|jgi:uncharacterized protein|nr:DUF484 family protein [Rhodospirillaceae bacterium]
MSDPVSTAPDVSEDEVDEAAVLAFLARNPDFLASHPDVLAGMAAPGRWSGDGVVDMQQFLINRRESEMDELRDAAQDVIETSRSNMSVQTRTHGAVLSLLNARAWEDVLRVVTQDWPLLLDVDAVSLGFEVAPGPGDRLGERPDERLMQNDIRQLPAGYVDRVLEGDSEVALFRQISDDGTLFAAAAGLVNSAALARIHAGPGWPTGMLALGGRVDTFRPGQGTELLSFLSRVLESCLARLMEAEQG